MNKKRIVLSMVLVLSLLLSMSVMATGYSKAERKDTVIFDIDFGRVSNPKNWNPYVQGSRLDQGLHQAMIEPLFILNYETGEITPWLAERYEQNKAANVWTIKLREGIKWSDGESMNADDVVFTINLVKNTPELVNASKIDLWVDRIKKLDDLTVQFNLTSPNPRFILDHFAVKIFSSHNILPEHIWKGKDPLKFSNYDPDKGWPVFTGPYKLESVSKSRFVFIRDDNWWGVKAGFKPLPKPKRLVWTAFGSEETRTAAMANHDLDSLMDINLDALFALQKRNPNVVAHYTKLPYSWPDPCARTLELNHEVTPWNDKDMRWALNYAINRDEVVSIAYDGATVASRHFFPAYSALNRYVDLAEKAGLYDKYPMLKTDPEKARKILESKGYTLNKKTGFYEKDGQELSIHIQTPEPFVEMQNIARVVVKQWLRIGINATWGNVDRDTFSDKFSVGDYQARVGWQACNSINEPWASMNTFNISWYKPVGERIGFAGIGGENGWRWKNKKYSAIVDKIGKLPLGDPRIDKLFVKAMDIWMDELPIIPVTQAKKIIPFNNTYWANWPTADNPYIHPPTWWQSTHVIIHNLEPSQRVVEKKREVSVGEIEIVTTQAPPFSYKEDGVVKGLSTEVVQAVLQEVGAKAEIKAYPWARAYIIATTQPNTLIYLIERLPDRESLFKWVGTITPINSYVYKLKSRTDIQIDQINDMKPYKIGVLIENSGHQYLRMRRIQRIQAVTRLEQNIRKLQLGRIDLMLAPESSFIASVKSIGVNLDKFEKAYSIDELSIDGYLAFSQGTPEKVVIQFREALARMKARGKYDAILKKYGYK